MPVPSIAFFFKGGLVSVITTIQYGSISMGSGTTATATITSIDTTKSVCIYLGSSSPSNAIGGDEMVRVALTNATTVTATRIAGTADAATDVGFVVITFTGVASIQQGTIAIATTATSNTATITSVNTAKAVCFFQGDNLAANLTMQDRSRVTLTNATTVTASRKGSGNSGTTTAGYVVIEFS